MKNTLIRPLGYLFFALLLVTDFLRTSVGALSIVVLSGVELVAFFELIAICILLAKSYGRLRQAQTKFGFIVLIFAIWLGIVVLIGEVINETGRSIAGHWDAEVVQLVSLGHSNDIADVRWDKDISFPKKCEIVEKKKFGLFPEMFEFKVKCARSPILVTARLYLHLSEGKASADVKLKSKSWDQFYSAMHD